MAKKDFDKQVRDFGAELDRIVREKSAGRTAQLDRLLGMQQAMYVFTRAMDHVTAKRFSDLFEAAWERIKV